MGGDQAGQEEILRMDFMVPSGGRLDLADDALCLPEEFRIHLAGRRPAYGSKILHVAAKDQHVLIPVGESREVKIGVGGAKMKLWVARGPEWVPTVISGLGKTKYLQMTNLGDREIILPTHYIRLVGGRRYGTTSSRFCDGRIGEVQGVANSIVRSYDG